MRVLSFSGHDTTGLAAAGNDIAIEELVLACESVTVE